MFDRFISDWFSTTIEGVQSFLPSTWIWNATRASGQSCMLFQYTSTTPGIILTLVVKIARAALQWWLTLCNQRSFLMTKELHRFNAYLKASAKPQMTREAFVWSMFGQHVSSFRALRCVWSTLMVERAEPMRSWCTPDWIHASLAEMK